MSGRRHCCAAFGCRRSVPFAYLMCGKHWAQVPRDIQRDVYAAWNRGRRTAAWNGAVERAIESLNRQGDLFLTNPMSPE